MFIHWFSFSLLLAVPIMANAAERYILDFQIYQGETKVEAGKTFVTVKSHTWSKGLKRTYMKMQCEQAKSGEKQRLLLLEDHFGGWRLTYQLVGNDVQLSVVRNVVTSRLTEIRAVPKNECRNILPQITTSTQSYLFPAKSGKSEYSLFDGSLTLRLNLQLIGAKVKAKG